MARFMSAENHVETGPHRDHGHDGHGHDHAPTSFGRAFAIGVGLNTAFVAIEAGYGIASGSMALVADAGHNLGDVLGLLVAWGASVLVARPPSERFTYGLKSSSILAALINAALLWIALGAILIETLRRLADPQPVPGGTVMAVAAVGIVINTVTALLFMRGRKGDLNVRGAFLHMAADAAVSAGVVVAGLAIAKTGAAWIDPVTSLAIVAIIGWGSWGQLRDSVKLGLLGVPEGIEPPEVRAWLAALPGVTAVHDLHIWPMSTTETAFTAHLVMPAGHPGDVFLHNVAHELEHRFGIGHPTIQVETEADCALHPEHVV
jgi:cobalt-zinc-cadmium efflux system protein